MSAGNIVEQSYEEIGIAEDITPEWSSPLEWLSDKHPQEYDFCVEYNIDNDEVQTRHESEMDEDGFFDHKSGTDCNCCGKNITPGSAYYRIDYADGSSQEPMCRSCVDDVMGEAE